VGDVRPREIVEPEVVGVVCLSVAQLIEAPTDCESSMVVPDAAVKVVDETSQSDTDANPTEFATVEV
jgi:hypothetical protein